MSKNDREQNNKKHNNEKHNEKYDKKCTGRHIIKRTLLGLAAALVCFILFICGRIVYSMLAPIEYNSSGSSDSSGNQAVKSTSWMSGIDDSMKLSEFTIPGTHDSATEHIMFPYSYSCQNTSVTEQLNAGFRFFDLRLQKVDDTESGNTDTSTNADAESAPNSGLDFAMHHGNGICKKNAGLNADTLYYSDICSQTYEFLEANPSECVIFLLSCDDNESLADFMADEISVNGKYWFTENVNPSLGDVRGKIVTITRDASNETGYGIGAVYTATPEDGPYESGTISCDCRLLYQDLYTLGVNDKWDAFDALLSDCPADENTFSVNYLSCASGLFNLPSPKENARALNKRLMQRELSEGNYGIVLVDFASEELAKKLYLTNFR